MDRYCWTKYGMLKTDEISGSLYRHGDADKTIERLKKALEEMLKIDTEVIEQLRKEKDWLINIHAEQLHAYAPFLLENEIEALKKSITNRMQQALK